MVIVIDDTVRGIARVISEEPVGLEPIPGLEPIEPNDIAELTILKGQDARAKATPCEVEGGIVIRTTRYKP